MAVTTTTNTTGLDPASEAYQKKIREQARSGADQLLNGQNPLFLGPDSRSIADQTAQFMNPYMDQVIGGVRGEFDQLRGQAGAQANANATSQGAFGGSRAAVDRGARLGALDSAQASQIGGLMSNGYQQALQQGQNYSEYARNLRERQAQEPMFRQQQALQMANQGMGQTGQVNTETQESKRDWLSTLAGGAMGLAGMAIPGVGAAQTLGGGLMSKFFGGGGGTGQEMRTMSPWKAPSFFGGG